MAKIENIHDSFFKKVFSDIANVRTFLEIALPAELRRQLDLSSLELDATSYVSEEYKASLSDVVVKCAARDKQKPVDVYLLFEHKSYPDKKIFIQLLRYMYLMWQQDSAEVKPLRAIIPLVFYHGKGNWKIPTQFAEQFEVGKELRRFLLNFEYLLFDANQWDWQAEASLPLKENVFLLSALLLMKGAYRKDLETIRQVVRLWNKMGLIEKKDQVNFLLIYIAETQDIPAKQLLKILEESELKGEDIMPTLAQRWKQEGIEEGIKKGIEQGIEQGIEKGIEKGFILDKQDVLIMLLLTRFGLEEEEKAVIRSIESVDKLNTALKMVLTAETGTEIIDYLNSESA
ncbi:MAG: Rpn family recombination-promoting nuclease/putative transposase [Calditrichaceae bacterium]|nr:Rpn family recombination-promoting nuclease/putative transposase [Calditrichia bacterium]NUQ42916.1 Rpn family recombination-promoting nuclease/putative transposase [Calditrichaceae bacterium]